MTRELHTDEAGSDVREVQPGQPNLAALRGLGVDAVSTTVYLAMVRSPEATIDDLARSVALEPSAVADSLTRLAELELLSLELGGRVSVRPPHRALDGLVNRREQELAVAAARLAESRSALSSVLESYVDKHRQVVADGLAHVEGIEPVRGLVRTLTERTVATIVNIMPRSPSAAALDAAASSDVVALSRGIEVRAVLPSSIARDARALESARASADRGVCIRLHPAPALQCMVFDGTTAIVPSDPASVSSGAWVVHNPGLLQPIKLLVESVWAQAVPVTATAAGGEEARIRAVFRLLAQGQKDETIARRLDTSVRTVRRLVALGMEQLGTDSRFEAGVMAQRRGWLSDVAASAHDPAGVTAP